MVKHTETIRRHIADELLECVWPICGVGSWGLNNSLQRQFSVWHKTTFRIINHSLHNWFDFLMERILKFILKPRKSKQQFIFGKTSISIKNGEYLVTGCWLEKNSRLYSYLSRVFATEKIKEIWPWVKKNKKLQKKVLSNFLSLGNILKRLRRLQLTTWFLLFFCSFYIERFYTKESNMIKTEIELCTQTWWKLKQGNRKLTF